jgi:hypothetical protein
MVVLAFLASLAVAPAAPARAEERARTRNTSWTDMMRGPFWSSRLFATPVADTVGPYVLAISWDGSLLEEPGILSSAGVIAIGFGDLAQLEYRHTAAISLDQATAPVPAVGLQLEAPLPTGRGWPALALAFRLGVPRHQDRDGLQVDETVTDLYAMSRLHLWGPLAPVTLHAGVRLAAATLELGGTGTGEASRRQWLPAGGVEVRVTDQSVAIVELGLAPSFDRDGAGAPTIGAGVIGRLGSRWFLHPAFSFDISLGYQRDDAATPSGVRSVIDWDIRLGGELFVPWGAIACRGLGAFCS